MLYAKIDENDNVLEYPVHDKWIRLRLNNISFSTAAPLPVDILAEHGYVPVVEVIKPTAKTKYYTNTAEKQVDGSWKQKWISADKTTAMKDQEKYVLKMALKKVRKEKEATGITFNSVLVDTSAESQHKLHAVRTVALEKLADANLPWTDVSWQGADGQWLTLTPQDVVDLSAAMFTHVEACYTAQKNTEISIDAETLSTKDEVADDFETELALLLGA